MRRVVFRRECTERIDTMDSQEIYEQIMMIMRLRISRQPMSQRRVLMRALAHGAPVTIHATPQEEPVVRGLPDVIQAAARVPSSALMNMLQQAAVMPPRRPLPVAPLEEARRLELDMRRAGISPFSAPSSGIPSPRRPSGPRLPLRRPRVLLPVRPQLPPVHPLQSPPPPPPPPPPTSPVRPLQTPQPQQRGTSPEGLRFDHIPLPPAEGGVCYRGGLSRGLGSEAQSTSSMSSDASR